MQSLLLCPACTERTFGSPQVAAEPTPTSGIGPPLEQMPERPEIPEAIYNDAPWAAPGRSAA